MERMGNIEQHHDLLRIQQTVQLLQQLMRSYREKHGIELEYLITPGPENKEAA